MKPNYKMIEEYVKESFNVDRLQETGLPLNNEKEICEAFKSVFHAEYFHEYNIRYYKTYQNVLANYLMGLPSSIDIAFENYKILELAKLWNSLPENATEKQEDKILENYWQFMALQIIKYCNKHKVDIFSK